MAKEDTKYLQRLKGRNIWSVRFKIPKDVRHAFLDNKGKARKVIIKTTNTEDLVTAQRIRKIFVESIKLKIQAVRSGDENLMQPLANLYKLEMRKYKDEAKELDYPHPAIDDLREEALARVKDLNLVDATDKEIVQAMTTPEGYISEEEALEKLDKTGRVKQFYDEVLGNSFDAYLDEWLVERRKRVGEQFADAGIKHIKTFQDYHPTIAGVRWKVVKQWIDSLNINSNTILGYMSSLRDYWKYLVRIVEHPDAKDPTAFIEHTMPKTVHAKRKAWEPEDVRRLYQNETVHTKNNPTIKDIILIGMFTGCRIEEITQFQVKNVAHIENIRCLCIDISKTDTHHGFGRRNTPIHTKLNPLIDRLLEEAGDDPEEYLIKRVGNKNKYNKRSKGLSQAFSRHKVKLGYQTKEINPKHNQVLLDFHSLRSTVNTFLRRKGLEQVKREVLCGWSKGFKNESMAENNYLDMEQMYKYNERKADIELLTELYDWLD
jgi:integrase